MEAKFEDVPDEVWKYVEPWLPRAPSHARGGRSRVDDRRALAGIVYRLKTGCQWKAIPRQFGSGSALHRRFQEWAEAGVFHISERRACSVVGQHRSTYRYRSRLFEPSGLRARLREHAAAHRGWGYKKMTILLRRDGYGVNHKRVYRIYRQPGSRRNSRPDRPAYADLSPIRFGAYSACWLNLPESSDGECDE